MKSTVETTEVPEQRTGPATAQHRSAPRRGRGHGAGLRGLGHVPESPLYEGRFGRMFRRLPPLALGEDEITALAERMVERSPGDPGLDNPRIPSGYTFLGQFIDHDITHDPTPLQVGRRDPDALTNFRSPFFDLDSVYGRGPADQPYLYDDEKPGHFLVPERDGQYDLQRNAQGSAIIPDPRNDENLFVTHLQLTLQLFHNEVLDALPELPESARLGEEDDFAAAQGIVRRHYQWVVIHDFLRRIVGEETFRDVLRSAQPTARGRGVERPDLRYYRWRNNPFMPVEFSVAAYRFGHSLIRARYKLNTSVPQLPIFTADPVSESDPLSHLGGFRALPEGWQIEWRRFFPLGADGGGPESARAIDPFLAPPLMELPEEAAEGVASLARRNLTRGVSLGLPSGQSVACAMGVEPLADADLGLPRPGPAPLWYYILREAEVVAEGRHLGPVGGRIVAEVFLGLLAADPASYLSRDPGWKPTLESAEDGDFTMSDLIRFTGFGLGEV
ncbi:peroxidase family protein [Streptomonospora litoralis]|uniref:Heme peroxidase n=1 Tax=Streptomonospora litoralis TaxID=2498135 RepID=A0A4P6PZZ4_9ACTN|nr:heme peroxidase family protein [Streptomonospora litoralis]QBI53916.1 heme peroxidase [Streptomonospora litoralis]